MEDLVGLRWVTRAPRGASYDGCGAGVGHGVVQGDEHAGVALHEGRDAC